MLSADMEKRGEGGREGKKWVVGEVGVERERGRQTPVSQSRSAVFKLGQVSN